MEERNAVEQFEKNIQERYFLKKKVNIVVCSIIFLLGVTAFVYKANYEGGFLTCFRELTCCGAAYSSVCALACAVISYVEYAKDTEFDSKTLYYFRLSSCATEFIILVIVIVGYLPFVPARPKILRYDMMNMHVLIPILTVLSFTINDPPIGKLKPRQCFGGLIFPYAYMIGILACILTGIVPREKIPYFFLDIQNQPLWFSLIAFALISLLGFALSWAFSELNRRAYWLWFKKH